MFSQISSVITFVFLIHRSILELRNLPICPSKPYLSFQVDICTIKFGNQPNTCKLFLDEAECKVRTKDIMIITTRLLSLTS